MIGRRAAAWVLGLLLSACALPQPGQTATVNCAAPGLGRGFHIGEALNRTPDDYRDMARAGASLVRLGVTLEACNSCSQYELAPHVIAAVERNLDLARLHNMRMVIVLRPAPEPESALWKKPELQRSLVDIWTLLAKRFKDRPEVAAFDLVNEPHPPGSSFPAKQAMWDELAVRLIRAIRSVDPRRALIIEPSPGARPMAFDYNVKPLPFDNLIYSTHMYEPFEVTHQRVNDTAQFAGRYRYPGSAGAAGYWNQDRMRKELEKIKRFGDEHRVEIFVGEFGAIRWAPDGSRERYLKDLLEVFHEYGWSWTFHAFREWQGWDAELPSSESDHTRRSSSERAFVMLSEAMRNCPRAAGRP